MRIVANPEMYKEKEALYIKVRDAEGRVPANDVVKSFPYVPADNPYKNEWDTRAKNLLRLLQYLEKKFEKPTKILDVGCGNGWMSHALYKQGYSVTGVDLNLTELKQAEEIFGEPEGLKWMYADILNDDIGERFDIILFAASCQYFPDLEVLTSHISGLLHNGGEIHLYDSMFYDRKELPAARQRSIDYYTRLGFPQMADYYFHHAYDTVKKLGFHNMNTRRWFTKKPLLEWWVKK